MKISIWFFFAFMICTPDLHAKVYSTHPLESGVLVGPEEIQSVKVTASAKRVTVFLKGNQLFFSDENYTEGLNFINAVGKHLQVLNRTNVTTSPGFLKNFKANELSEILSYEVTH